MKKSALIIGGGIAGLAAARALARAGLMVTLLEAKERCGGRIHTLREHKFPIELGAEFVHGAAPVLMKTLQEAKLPMLDVPGRSLLYANGKLSEVDIWKTAGDVFRRIDVSSADCSCEEFLARSVSEPARTYVRNFVQGFHAADPRRISVHALREGQLAADEINGSESQWLATGYGSLVDFFEKETDQLGVKIHKCTAVRKMAWREGSVAVSADEIVAGKGPAGLREFLSVPAPVVPPAGGLREFAAEAVIVTVPIGILKNNELQFEPPLPQKLEAAQKLELGNVIKITFVFDEPVLEGIGFVHAFDAAIPTWWSDTRGPTVVGWAGGPKADALVKLFPAQLEILGLEILGRIFPSLAPKLRRKFVRAHCWNWKDDPHIRGAYSYIPVGGRNLPRQLAEPVAGTLLFAGEATVADAQMGTVFGALETGLRAAHELLSAA